MLENLQAVCIAKAENPEQEFEVQKFICKSSCFEETLWMETDS